MNTPYKFEQTILKLNSRELIHFLQDYQLLKREYLCSECNVLCSFVPYKRSIDGFSWRCMKSTCKNYKNYVSIRINSFFLNFNIDMKRILSVILKYSVRQPLYSIILSVDISEFTIKRIINQLTNLIAPPDFSNSKLGGPGRRVEIDETMLNFKAKSHRGRSPLNRSDALCIVEVGYKILRVFACVIPDKSASTLIPIITSQVANGSVIWTDEMRSYGLLRNFDYYHETVCHKYEFINSENGVNTQSVESFNNFVKLEIKKRKGVKTCVRDKFLNEVCFYFNNKNNFLKAVLDLIKI